MNDLEMDVPSGMEDPAGLRVQTLSIAYGNIVALWDASIVVGQREIVALIGANGAGKSTLVKAVMGLVKPRHGKVTFDGTDLGELNPHQIVSRGVAYVPEGRRLFPGMSVEENLRISTSRKCPDLAQRIERVFDLFPVLKERKGQAAGTLSGGEQQMVAIGRALMAKPKLMLLDEPSFGLSPLAYDKVVDSIREINQEGVGILLAEQNSERALELSHRAYVLENGRIGMKGASSALMNDPAVKVAYLGL